MAIITESAPSKVTLIPAECGEGLPLKIIKTTDHGKFFRSVVKIPSVISRQGWALQVYWADGTKTTENAAVRTLGMKHPDSFTLLLYSDHQLRDPSWKVLNGFKGSKAFPRHGEEKLNRSITRQQLEEIRLLDPDYTIHLGDLIFGLEFTEEYPMVYDIWSKSVVPSYFIPGNHDAYATYSLKLPSLNAFSTGFLKCRNMIPTSKSRWFEIFSFISCLYGDIKNELFNNLVSDGLVHWKHWMGPINQSFTRGKFRFVFINTYGGTPERRHSFSVYIKALGYHLGAPAVDNYGGYLSDTDLAWIESELKKAASSGLTPVIFGHHDPRGNRNEKPFHKNEPFPTNPIGADHFEEWNFDDDWDSDPSDKRTKETASENSGTKFVRILAKYGGYYLSGHVHKDDEWHYKKGEKIIDGVSAQKDISFIKVTTGASSRKDDGYWGMRFIKARSDGTLDLTPHAKNQKSIPSGNVWYSFDGNHYRAKVSTFQKLGKPLPVNIRLCLPYSETGYEIKNSDGETMVADTDYPGEGKQIYTFKHTLKTDQEFDFVEVKKNLKPKIRVRAGGKVYESDAELPGGLLNADASIDPENKGLFSPYWLVEENVYHGFTLDTRTFKTPFKAIFRVRDNYGVWTQASFKVTSNPPADKPGGHGCGCLVGNRVTPALKLLIIILALLFTIIRVYLHIRFRRRRKAL